MEFLASEHVHYCGKNESQIVKNHFQNPPPERILLLVICQSTASLKIIRYFCLTLTLTVLYFPKPP